MKTCPVCNAIAFDDQAICFGCLHNFGKDALSTEMPKKTAGAEDLPDTASFLLSLVPQLQNSGSFSWICTVEPLVASR